MGWAREQRHLRHRRLLLPRRHCHNHLWRGRWLWLLRLALRLLLIALRLVRLLTFLVLLTTPRARGKEVAVLRQLHARGTRLARGLLIEAEVDLDVAIGRVGEGNEALEGAREERMLARAATPRSTPKPLVYASDIWTESTCRGLESTPRSWSSAQWKGMPTTRY